MPVYQITTTQVITETYRLYVEASDEEAAEAWTSGIGEDLLYIAGADRTQRSDIEDGDVLDIVEMNKLKHGRAILRATWNDGSAAITYAAPDGWHPMETAPKDFPDGVSVEKTSQPVKLLFDMPPGAETPMSIAVWAAGVCGKPEPHWRRMTNTGISDECPQPIAWKPLGIPEGWEPMASAPRKLTATSHFSGVKPPLILRHGPAVWLRADPYSDVRSVRAIWARPDTLEPSQGPCWRAVLTGHPISFIPVAWRLAEHLEAAGTALEGDGEGP
jgi:hypothetical protein